ncbi:MAG: hypothetical protein V9E81_01200 [Marmoricola sp.]
MGEVGGFSVMVRDQRFYLIEAAEKGMAGCGSLPRARLSHGSMRHRDNAVTRIAEAVARIGRHTWPVHLTEPMKVLLASVGEVVGVEATPDNAEELVEEFGQAARMLASVIRNTQQPHHAQGWLQGQRGARRGLSVRRRAVLARTR